MTKFSKKGWGLLTVNASIMVVFLGGIGYYSFFAYPKQKAMSFLSKVSSFEEIKNDTEKLEGMVVEWGNITKGDIKQKTEELNNIKENFNNLEKNISSVNSSSEIAEAIKLLQELSKEGKELSTNLIIVLDYFIKVENSVKTFNDLNTESKTLDEIKSLVMNFKSISEGALQEMEKIETPKIILSLDKDYKDLLRQFIVSADELLISIQSKDIKKIESVGKTSDIAVNSIIKQLEEDLAIFKTEHSLTQKLLKIKNLQKAIDENISGLKIQYGL